MRPTSRPYIDVTRDCLGPSVMELVLVSLVTAIWDETRTAPPTHPSFCPRHTLAIGSAGGSGLR